MIPKNATTPKDNYGRTFIDIMKLLTVGANIFPTLPRTVTKDIPALRYTVGNNSAM
jgi:hypothetical protein